MANAMSEAKSGLLRLLFRGSVVFAYLTELVTDFWANHRTGKNGLHALVGLLW
jgi:hypothetical protein